MPPLALVINDCAHSALVDAVDASGGLESVVITNALYASQPLWMRGPGRRFRVHMVWYSQNTIPPVLKADGLRANFPNYRHLSVDEHWVWTPSYAQRLRDMGVQAQLHTVGPLLWYLPERNRIRRGLTIALFDVTPVTAEFAKRNGLEGNYYATENMVSFLREAVRGCEVVAQRLGLEVSVVLKHKRPHGTAHDARYVAVVHELSVRGRLKLVSPQTNLFSLIGGSAAVVVVPYSSPAYVASYMQIPAIFFDASGMLEPTHEPSLYVDFVSGDQALVTKLLSVLSEQGREPRLV
jgi:polysaccharide biosynthesis PFTS motif protein